MPYTNYPQQYPYFQPYQPTYQPPQYIQPQGNPVPMQTPVQPMQQPQTVQPYQQAQGLQGKFVDSIESVRATDVLMDGSVMYFPCTDGKTIYTKQLRPDGTSDYGVFVRQTETEAAAPQVSITDSMAEIVEGKIKSLRDEINAGFEEVSDRFDKITKQLRGKGDKE